MSNTLRIRTLVFAVILRVALVLLPALAAGQEFAERFGMPLTSSFSQNRDIAGLSGTLSTLQTRDGSFWTSQSQSNEIWRFDGISSLKIELDFSARALAEGPNGKLWIAGKNGVLHFLDPTLESKTAITSSLRELAINTERLGLQLYVIDQTVYVRHSNGISVVDTSRLEEDSVMPSYIAPTSEDTDEPLTVTCAGPFENQFLVGTTEGLYQFENGEYSLKDFADVAIRGLLQLNDGRLCVITHSKNKLVAHLDGKQTELALDMPYHFLVTSPIQLRDQTILIPCLLGLIHLSHEGDLIRRFTKEDLPALEYTFGAYEDDHGIVWVDCGYSLERIHFGLGLRQLPYSEVVYSMMPLDDSTIYLAGQSGIVKWHGQLDDNYLSTSTATLLPYTPPAGLEESSVGIVEHIVRREDSLFAAATGGIFEIDLNTEEISPLNVEGHLYGKPNPLVLSVTEDPLGVMCVTGPNKTVFTRLEWIDKKTGEKSSYPSDPLDGEEKDHEFLHLSERVHLCMHTQDGTRQRVLSLIKLPEHSEEKTQISRWNFKTLKWESVEATDDEAAREKTDPSESQGWLGIGRHGDKMLAISGSAVHEIRFDGTSDPELRHFADIEVTETESSWANIVDGSIYLFSSGRIRLYQRKNNEYLVANEMNLPDDLQLLSRGPRLRWDATHLYFLTGDSVQMLPRSDLADDRPQASPPEVRLSISVGDGEANDLDDFISTEIHDVPFGSAIQIAAVPTELFRESENRYEFILSGPSTDHRKLHYSNHVFYHQLAPGQYEIEVNGRGFRKFKTATIGFNVLPPWHRTWWGRSLIACGMLLGVVAIVYGWNWSISKRLRQMKNEYRTIFDQSMNVVLVTDDKGKITQANPAAVTLVGAKSARQLVSKSIRSLVSSNGAETQEDGLVKKLDGSTVSAEIKQRRLDAGHTQWHIRDLTEDHEIRRRLTKAASLKAMGLLASSIAHDFRNMLTIISLSHEIVSQRLGSPGAAEIHSADENIRTTLQHGKHLADRLMSLGKATDDETGLGSMNLCPTLKTIHDSRLAETKIKWRLTMPESVYVLANADGLMRVFLNLYQNASDSVSNTGEVTTTVTCEGSKVQIRIRDTGVGIPHEQVERVFEPYFTTKDDGTGLGLLSCRETLQAMGGSIQIESEEGIGTSVIVTVRRADAPEQQPAVTSSMRNDAQAPSTALIVDDDRTWGESIALSLEVQGLKTTYMSNSVHAQKRLQEEEFDVLITDLVMPNLNGMELANAAKEAKKDIIVILLSGYTDVLEKQKTLRPDVLDHIITKPTSASQIIELLK